MVGQELKTLQMLETLSGQLLPHSSQFLICNHTLSHHRLAGFCKSLKWPLARGVEGFCKESQAQPSQALSYTLGHANSPYVANCSLYGARDADGLGEGNMLPVAPQSCY